MMLRRQFLSRSTLAAMATAWPGPLWATEYPLDRDLEYVRQAMALHPGALRYLDEAEFVRAFAELEQNWHAAIDLPARYLTLSSFLSRLRCGHTHCNFYNQSDDVRSALFERTTRLPFFFRWLDGAMIVTRDLTDTALVRPGTRIESIDDRKPNEMLAALLQFAHADGANDGKRVAQLEVTGGERFPAFDIFQGMMFPPLRDGWFSIAWTAPDGTAGRAEVRALSPSERLAASPPPEHDGSPLWTLERRDDGIAVLTMPTWAIYSGGWDWGGWLMEQAPKLYAARGLVIDIRGNEGGVSCGNPILARLSNTDIPLDAFRKLLRFRRIPDPLNAVMDTPSPTFRTLGLNLLPVGNGFYGQPTDAAPEVIEATTPRLTNPVAVLTDAANSSATFLFAHTIKRYGLARLFGGTTGGNMRGINAGAVGFVRLPASGIEFDVPLIGYFSQSTASDRGLEPDVAVPVTAEDITNGRDPVIEAATAWISQNV